MPIARFALRGLLALALLVLALLLLQRTDAHRDMSAGQKLLQLQQLGDDVDFVAVGSSRTKFHMIPDVLDSTMAAHGRPVRSYNYGLLGTPATEISYAVDRVLEADLPALRTVAVELQPIPLRELHWHPLSRKGAYHFDVARVRLGLDATRASDLSPTERRAAYARFLKLGLRHYLVAGQGTNLVRSWLTGRRRTARELESRGFTPLDEVVSTPEEQMNTAYRRYLALEDSLSAPGAVTPTGVDSVLARHFLETRDRAAASGVAVVFIVQPMTTGVEGLALLLEGAGAPTVRLNNPAHHPELYEFDLWYDGSHLNVEGAQRLTEAAARAVAEALARAEAGR